MQKRLHSITLPWPNPHCQLIPVSASTCMHVWMKHIASASGAGEDGRWHGCPLHVCFFLGRTMHLSELLLKEGKGISVHGQLAGSMPRTHPSPYVSTHTDTHSAIKRHGPQLKYLPGTCKQKVAQEIMINPRLLYDSTLHPCLSADNGDSNIKFVYSFYYETCKTHHLGILSRMIYHKSKWDLCWLWCVSCLWYRVGLGNTITHQLTM